MKVEIVEGSSTTTTTIDPVAAAVQNQYCAVCGDQADGYHYAVLSCRGCNAFFRRAVTYNLQFQCRRGGNCVIDRNARCACRACRLARCKLIGMDRTAVQIKKESMPQQQSNGTSPTASPTTSTATTTTAVNTPSAFTPLVPRKRFDLSALVPALGGGLTPVMGSALAMSSPNRSFLVLSQHHHQNDSLDVLTRMVEDYFDQRSRRRSMLCNTLEEILCDTQADVIRLRGAASLQDISAVYRVQMILMFEWAEKQDTFQLIADPHDKAKLLKAFSMKYLILDNVFHTLELNYSDRLVLVNNTFVQPGMLPPPPPLDLNGVGGEAAAQLLIDYQRAMSMMYGENATRILEDLLRPMIDMQITFGEIIALRLMIFYSPGLIGLAPPTITLIQGASEKAIQALQQWYEDHHFQDIKLRLGNLLLLLTPLAKHTQHLSELTTLIPEFGLMPEWDSFMSDLLQ